METRVVKTRNIPRAGEGELRTKFSKEFAKARTLKRGEALELSYSRNTLADKARETLWAVIKRHKLNYHVVLRSKKVYITRK
jgi:hypothetical protein